ncbi:MAG: L,D-transpeptidase family protein [Flavobacteriales bacterium]|nr:L,D-transpeptidase family protein [Flavobacteriales bacterium]
MRASILVSTLLIASACSTPEPVKTQAEETREIAEVFETKEAYTARTLDSTSVARYLLAHPTTKSDSAAIVAFYQRRGYHYAWFVDDSLSHAAIGFASLVGGASGDHPTVAALHERLRELIDPSLRKGQPHCDSCGQDLELTLTAEFFQFANRKYGGMVGKDLRELDWFIPRTKKNYDRLIDSIAAGRMDLRAIEPLHPQYALLKEHLRRYVALDTLVRWEPISLGERKKLEPGDSASILPDIRHRLMILGDLVGLGDTIVLNSTHYDSTLLHAMLRFQERHNLLPDGVIGNSVIRALNVTPAQRVRTMLVNMERLRWVPEAYAPDLILVNIPEFRMHIFEDGKEAWNMKVVVGTVATRTVIFSDTLSNIVFSPTWTVPQSIVRGEILPAIRKDPNYLAKKGMERIGGTEANPIIRQKPGAGNALGRVKFLFPNDYSIYFHDTPSKGGFVRESRAFSHGCIRLNEPQRLAEYLLRNDSTWTTEKIAAAMNKKSETWVRLKDAEKRPVTIGYFTAWVGTDGRVYFCDDVYGHDDKLAKELFFDPTPAPVPVPVIQAEPEASRN